MDNYILKAVTNTKAILPDYWEATLKQRLKGGAGSCFEQFETVNELEEAILKAKWVEVKHLAVMEGCKCFKTNMTGLFGLVEIENLTDNIELVADDRKNTGNVSMTVTGVKGDLVNETYLIIGKEQGLDVVFTIHPGEPVRPSVISVNDLQHGTIVSKEIALSKGFKLAKIC